ncbi:MAG TPA: PEP-CTERM sorting domain-containing protein [Anaerohalosphaeraceae bacterium]|nr:PEP-CTERM sorting domain-containing protein [Anaerohalosphaeraceae bacterium]HPD48185.1 PEP-CTERM sorting domain-containing protein [Anaerohalosphaeraceae bacterium]HRT24327.1 PEP-CTERM sorting domain-containing protein [Anaerohalosphaeraceae bacterium]
MKQVCVMVMGVLLAGFAYADLARGVNLLANPSFEEPTIEPWLNDGCISLSISTMDAVDGVQSLQMHYDSDFDAVYQPLPIGPGDLYQTFQMTFSVKSLESKPVIVRAGIWEFSPNGITFNESDWVAVGTNWQIISYEVTLNRDNTDAIRAVVQCAPQDTPKTPGNLLVDNVSLIVVPEPAAMLLLGLGGLILRMRK